ncbi:hypothetical protein [Geotalea sp. SG265]|uniref:hypothetical protein n=1 Tax=Geotalea sp. SG265 TaxID=2922867 RepID=UPI001FAEA9DB|nr:hypothetical protein [Geotalea sp. SG265]
MLKRLTYLLTLSLALPAFANAATWTVKATSAQPAMGSVTPSGYQNYTSSSAKSFQITPATGNDISKVLLNNVSLGAVSTVSVSPRSTMQTIIAYFAAKTFLVTATANAGGGVTSATSNTVAYGKSKSFSIKPNVGFKILSVIDNDVPQTVTNTAGMTYTIASFTAPHTVAVTFASNTANAGPDQKIVLGETANLSGSGDGTAFAWAVLSKPSNSIGGTFTGSGANVGFTPDVTGIYAIQLTVSDTLGNGVTDIVAVSAYATNALDSNQCAGCHYSKDNAFTASYHWNNHLETGPEFTDPGTGINGVLNANTSYTTLENGVQVTCSIRCHFRNITQKSVYGCSACHSDGLKAGGSFKNASSAHKEKVATYQNTCMYCHTGIRANGTGHGVVPAEFWGSKHWQNNFEYGPEFANQLNTTVSGGIVTSDGSHTDEYLNANDSYTTTENGTTVTCAYRCHFRPGMGPSQNVGTVLANGKSTGYITYTDSTGKYGPANTVYSRPGGDACMACHDSHNPDTATAQSTCYTCHAGGNHGWSVAAFEKSSHFNGTYAKLDGMDKESCLACHNAHSTEATFGAYSTLTPVAATGCQTCHTPGAPYGIYNADQTGKAPHVQTGTADAGGYYPTASYITKGGATCASCHYHNNSVNAGWAEGGHGKVDAPAFVSNATHNWNGQGTDGVNYQVSPQKTNCIRCHSSRGFAQFWDSGFSNIDKVYLDPVAKTLDKASAPLTCDGCHSGAKGVRGAVRPMPTGFTKVKSFYGYSNATIAGAKMTTSLEFTDNKNSNICLPCHSQRAAGTGIKALFAQGAFKQYSVGTAMYPHEAQPAAIVDGKGGYEFASAQGYQDRMRHIRIGNYGTGTGYNNTGITSGNCAGCHMTSEKTHALEAVTEDATTGQINGIATTLCSNCHPVAFTYQDIQKKKDAFNASVAALGKLLVQKGFTQDGVNVLPERKAFDMSLGTKDNAIAEKNIGAWFNWYLFKTADSAAYVHNPAYSRRLINDSIDWLDDHVINDSAAATIQNLATAGTITAAEKDLAVAQLNNPGCMGCHFGTGSTLGAEAVPGIEQAPHFNTNGALVPGQTFTQAQYVVPNTQCNYCHGYGHGTDSPGSTVITEYAASGHGSIDGMAWTDYDFKTHQGCVQCHTTKGFVDNVGAAFAAGTAAPSINAYGITGDATKQVLGCNACHSSTAWKTSIRNSGAVTAPMGVGGNTPKAVMNFADVGESNVCILCHASRENGESLVAGNPTNAAGKGFTNPHYLGAAAVFYGKGGFKFYTSGVRYNEYGAAGKVGKNANWSHGRLGMDNYSSSGNNDLAGVSNDTGNKGQCVACHLGPKNTHTFGAAEVANATMAGATNLVSDKPMTRTCYGCHKANADSPVASIEQFIDEEKEIWYRMFDFFKWQLAQYNIIYADAYPYFSGSFDVTVGTTFGGAGIVDNNKTRGAAMNLKLLLAEKGSHVHNRAFGRALIADSIVYLQKGDVGDRTVVYPDQNQVIKFSDYSAARPTSYPGQVGPDVSITTLKSYLTRSGTGGYTRR